MQYKLKQKPVNACQFIHMKTIRTWLDDKYITYNFIYAPRAVIKVPVEPMGVIRICRGDWVIQKHNGELDSLSDEGFRTMYEPIIGEDND